MAHHLGWPFICPGFLGFQVWDLNTLLCVQTLQGHTGSVMSVLCWDKYLLSCSMDGTIKVGFVFLLVQNSSLLYSIFLFSDCVFSKQAWGATKAGDIEMIYSHKEEHVYKPLKNYPFYAYLCELISVFVLAAAPHCISLPLHLYVDICLFVVSFFYLLCSPFGRVGWDFMQSISAKIAYDCGKLHVFRVLLLYVGLMMQGPNLFCFAHATTTVSACMTCQRT